jgi:hypothetical protein
MALLDVNYHDFIQSIEFINFDILNGDQEREIMTLCETRKQQNVRNALRRKIEMDGIRGMSYDEFIEALQYNSLPTFDRACRFDDDFVTMYRDTNHPQGLQRAYIHREQLAQTERDTFIATHILSIEDAAEYENRKECMDIILELTEPQFTEALNTDTLPGFVRAKVGDPDYTEFNAPDGYKCAFGNRLRLRTMEIEQFKEIYGI